MVARSQRPFITPEEYLHREQHADTKSEYDDGVIVAMSGATPEHVDITVNLIRLLGNQLADKPCKVSISDMRIRVAACNRYFYPDLSVTCVERQYERVDGLKALLNPTLIIEVLSESTDSRDRGEKWLCYQTLASLATYVLVSQYSPQIEIFSRLESGGWRYDSVTGLDAVLLLPTISCQLKLADVYVDINFSQP